MDNSPRIVRSLVFVPAHDGEHALEVARRGLDAICLDLEDLTPRDEKAQARRIFPSLARELSALGVLVFARTNSLHRGMARDDLDAIVCPDLHCVSIPKASSSGDVDAFCALLEEVELRNGVPLDSILVRPIIETAAGVRRAYEIASASPRIAYMGGVSGGWWGDLSSSLGYVPTRDGRETLYVRSKVLVDVRDAGVPFPIGGGTVASHDPEAVRAYALENRNLGYNGFHCSADPAAIAIVNEVFTPTAADIEGWLALLPTLEAAERDGVTALETEGTTLDLAGLVKVRQQLDLARRLGVLKG